MGLIEWSHDMFDPRDPYERCYWHYDSMRPLSIVQLIARKSVDVETAALVWLILEHGASFTIAGPTAPKPGVGKTTVLNELFQFLLREQVLYIHQACTKILHSHVYPISILLPLMCSVTR